MAIPLGGCKLVPPAEGDAVPDTLLERFAGLDGLLSPATTTFGRKFVPVRADGPASFAIDGDGLLISSTS